MVFLKNNSYNDYILIWRSLLRQWLPIVLSPISFLVVYDIVFIYRPLVINEAALPVEFVIFMITMDLMMLFFLRWLYFYSKTLTLHDGVGMKNLSSSNYLRISWQGYTFLLIVTASIFLYLVFKVFGNLELSNLYLNNQIFYSQSKIGSSWLFFFLYAAVFVVLYDNYLNGFTKYSMFISLILIQINAATGGRGHVITYLLLFLMIYLFIWRGKKVLLVGGMVVILIFSSFAYNTLFRSGSSDISEYLESSSSLADMNQAHAISDAIDYWKSEGACYTCFIEDVANLFVPRNFFPDKPISNAETRAVYPKVAARGTTQTFGIYGGSFINIGLLTYLFVPVFYFLYAFFICINTTLNNRLKGIGIY